MRKDCIEEVGSFHSFEKCRLLEEDSGASMEEAEKACACRRILLKECVSGVERCSDGSVSLGRLVSKSFRFGITVSFLFA